MTALETLQQARLEIANKYNCVDWEEFRLNINLNVFRREFKTTLELANEEASLLAMERIAEMSWEKAYFKSLSYRNEEAAHYANHGDKSTYMNNLFPKNN